MAWRNKNYNKANRGKQLEQMIEQANERYKHIDRALVQKIPTPVKVLNNNGGKVTGFYEKKSTVDYIGTYKGVPITFDAKQTSIETRFDLSNLKKHQYNYMKNWQENGGITFLVVRFSSLDEIYYLPFKTLQYWQEEAKRKSIPYDSFEHKIKTEGLVVVDYLSTLEKVEEV